MSVSRGFGLNGKSFYSNISKPQSVFLSWSVLATNGLGVSSVKSNGYANYVFMHTSTTPTATNGRTNPNPAAGYALIGLTNNFNKFLGVRGQVSNPASNTSQTSVTTGGVYVITALGSATLAQWIAVGYPYGFTPAVGQSFVATASQAIGGSAMVGDPGKSLVSEIALVGDPSLLISNSNISQYGGAQIMLAFEDISATGTVSAPLLTMDPYTPAGTNNGATPPIFTGTQATLTGTNSVPLFTSTASAAVVAPTDGAVVRLELCFDGSSVSIDGL